MSVRWLVAWVNLPALLASVLWCAVNPYAKVALAEFPLLAYIAWRPWLAAALIFGVLRLRGVSVGIARQDWPRLVTGGIFGMGVAQLFAFVGLRYTSVAHNALLFATAPLLGAVLVWLLYRTRPSGRTVVGLLLGFVGIGLLVHGGGMPQVGASLFGDLLTLVAALGWVGVTLIPAPLVKRYGPLTITGWLMLITGLGLLPFSLGEVPLLLTQPPSLVAWGSLLYSAVLGMVVATALWQRAVQQVGPTQTLVYLYLQTLGAVLLATLVLGEQLGIVQLLAGLVLLVGIGLVRRA